MVNISIEEGSQSKEQWRAGARNELNIFIKLKNFIERERESEYGYGGR